MKRFIAGVSSLASFTLLAAPALANAYLITVPLVTNGVPAGTKIVVSCHAVAMPTRDHDALADAHDGVSTTVTSTGASSSVTLTLVTPPVTGTSGPKGYECWSDFGGYVSGSLRTNSGAPASPNWDVTKNPNV